MLSWTTGHSASQSRVKFDQAYGAHRLGTRSARVAVRTSGTDCSAVTPVPVAGV
jgi:hypothetical protein